MKRGSATYPTGRKTRSKLRGRSWRTQESDSWLRLTSTSFTNTARWSGSLGLCETLRLPTNSGRRSKGKGAFRYFKDTADRLGLLNRWFQYRNDAVKEFVVEWAEDNNVPYEDDVKH